MQQPYGNSYFNTQTPASYQRPIQPYQMQPMYQQPMNFNQPQQPIQPVQQAMQIQYLPGQMVDGIESVRAKDVDMSGNPVFYPKTDGSEIYRKQLQADGTSRIFTYRLAQDITPVNENSEPAQQPVNMDAINNLFEQFKQDVLSEIADIKNLVAQTDTTTPKTTNSRGGSQKQ